MFEGMKDMGKLLKQAKEMKSKMKQVQDELKTVKVSGTALEGKIQVVMTGELEVVDLKLDDSVINTDNKKRLEDGLKQAVNEAAKKSKEIATSRLADISSGLKIPGLT